MSVWYCRCDSGFSGDRWIVFKVHLLMGELSIYQVKSNILGMFLVLKCALICALDSFENDFLGKNLMEWGKVLYMYTALCIKLLDVFADKDLYFTDGFRTCLSMSDLTKLWYKSCDSAGGCDSYEILCISLIDSCMTIWW